MIKKNDSDLTLNLKNDFDVSVYSELKFAKNASFKKIIASIQACHFDEKINKIRRYKSEGDGKWQDLKSQLLAFTPSATFNDLRRKEFLINYNQIIVLDFDHLAINVEEVNSIVVKANADNYTYASFISPSGTGIKLFTKVDSEKHSHEQAYNRVADYYEHLLNVKVDRSGKDITRLCYISSDDRAYININANTFHVISEDAPESLTEGAPQTMVQGIDREAQFKKIIELSQKTKSFEVGNRNNFVNLLANNCNRWGIPFPDAEKLILSSEFCYNNKEVGYTLKSAYKKISEFNKFPLFNPPSGVANVAKVAQHDIFKNNKLKTFVQLAAQGKSLPPLKKLFGNFILENSTTLFPSERGIGKSMLAMQLAIKIAGGAKEFIGEKIELNGNVLYINLELGERQLSKRMQKLLEGIENNNEFIAYSLTEKRGIFNIITEIKEMCTQLKPVLLIIDNLRTAFAGKDNEANKEMSLLIGEINMLKEEFNCAILIVHHTRKGSNNQLTNSDMQSGAGALSDLVDADFFLRKSGIEKNYRILKRVKARECEEQDGAKLISLNPDTLWFEFLEEGVDESIHVLDEKSMQHREKRNEKINQLIKAGANDAFIAREMSMDRSSIGRIRKQYSNK